MLGFFRVVRLSTYVIDGNFESAISYYENTNFKGRNALFAELKYAQALFNVAKNKEALKEFESLKDKILSIDNIPINRKKFLLGFCEFFIKFIRTGRNNLIELDINIQSVPRWMRYIFHYGYHLPGTRY